MTEKEYQDVKAKVLREYPVRRKLAAMAGRKLDAETLLELHAIVAIMNADRLAEADALIAPLLGGKP